MGLQSSEGLREVKDLGLRERTGSRRFPGQSPRLILKQVDWTRKWDDAVFYSGRMIVWEGERFEEVDMERL